MGAIIPREPPLKPHCCALLPQGAEHECALERDPWRCAEVEAASTSGRQHANATSAADGAAHGGAGPAAAAAAAVTLGGPPLYPEQELIVEPEPEADDVSGGAEDALVRR